MEMFSAIARIPSLQTAEFWLDLASDCRKQKPDDEYQLWKENYDGGCSGRDQYLLPFVNESSTLEVFKYLRAEKQGNELTNVIFWAGDWSRAWDGPLYFAPWIEHRRAKVSCDVKAGKKAREEQCVVLEGQNYWEGDQTRDWDILDID